jgi:hypothetical protein
VIGLLAAACVHKPSLPTPVPTGAPVRLGWRWVPGMRQSWRSTVRRVTGRLTTSRVEVWRYTAIDLEASGVVHLHGRLVGFGAEVALDGIGLPDDRIAAARDQAMESTPTEVALSMSLTGRILSCSEERFDASLPHRLLGSRLPSAPVVAGEAWADPALAVPFARVLPLDAPASAEVTTTLRSVEAASDGWIAELTHHGTLRTTAGGPLVVLRGTTTWATDPGAIVMRQLDARLQPDDADAARQAGTLMITLQREETANS